MSAYLAPFCRVLLPVVLEVPTSPFSSSSMVIKDFEHAVRSSWNTQVSTPGLRRWDYARSIHRNLRCEGTRPSLNGWTLNRPQCLGKSQHPDSVTVSKAIFLSSNNKDRGKSEMYLIYNSARDRSPWRPNGTFQAEIEHSRWSVVSIGSIMIL